MDQSDARFEWRLDESLDCDEILRETGALYLQGRPVDALDMRF